MAGSLFKRSLALLSVAIFAAALVFVAVGSAVTVRAYASASAAALRDSAIALSAVFPPDILESPREAAAYARAAASSGYRVTLILPDGSVAADSEADPATMENHGTRPEVMEALAGRPASSRRVSATLGQELVYSAAPIRVLAASGPGAGIAFGDAGAIKGVVRISLHVPGFESAIRPSLWAFALAALGFALAAFAAAASFSRMISRPLAALAVAAKSYGSGSADAAYAGARAIGPRDPEEIRVLARTLDSMASEIGRRVGAAEAQGRELTAILEAMAEAVLALDSRLAIAISNPAAEELFAAEGRLAGRGLLEATRSSALQELASDCLAAGERRTAEISLFLPAERVFRAFAAPTERASGLVLVLSDISELRRLERVRRDFVANVSHELRTPIQLIKGFAETLRDGASGKALAPAFGDPDQAMRGLGIIERNAIRMERLVADLLSLASLEREDRDWLKAERCGIASILRDAREALLPKAEERKTEILVECDESLFAAVDPGLVEQALVNLVDNAVKYSPPGTTVRVGARAENTDLVLTVRDQGIGISARDLGRVFERFYRVDRARSRELGGTGLGLAIVRHIAKAHGGEATVESWEGEGSTFTIRLPRSVASW